MDIMPITGRTLYCIHGKTCDIHNKISFISGGFAGICPNIEQNVAFLLTEPNPIHILILIEIV